MSLRAVSVFFVFILSILLATPAEMRRASSPYSPIGTPTPVVNRALRAGNVIGSPGEMVVLPIELDARGDEAALQFSLSWDTAILSSPSVSVGNGIPPGTALTVNPNQVASGRIGVLMDSTNTFAASPPARVVVNITFNVAANAPIGTNSPFVFGDVPSVRGFSDAFGNALTASYINGSVVIANPASGVEGDVTPRANPDGVVLATDVTQIRRFATFLDPINTTGNEGQRADCAPRGTLGDGLINSADVIQARRYSTGLDPAMSVGGPLVTAVSTEAKAFRSGSRPTTSGRDIFIGPAERSRDGRVVFPVFLIGSGDEAAISFTAEFDPSVLGGPSVRLGSAGMDDAVLTVNDGIKGRLAILIDSATAIPGAKGPVRVASISFDPVADIGSAGRLWLTRSLADMSVSDVHGNVLAARFFVADNAR